MANEPQKVCGDSIAYTLSVVGGKWKWLILGLLFEHDVLRYGQIKRNISGITHKMLSQQLKELEASLLIHRKAYQQVPPKVEYSLTENGKTLIPILKLMGQWGHANQNTSED